MDAAALKFSVSDLVVNLPFDGRGVHDVQVRNRGDYPLYMTTTPLKVSNPGASPEALEPTAELLVSPRRFTLEKGAQRAIRLLVAKPVDESKESVFRVQLVPDAEPFDNQPAGQQIKITTGLALLVTTGPKDPRPQIQWRWIKNTLQIENTGNINVLLERGQSCVKQRCSPIPPRRLYPGGRWKMTFQQVESVEFLQRSSEGFQQLVIPKE